MPLSLAAARRTRIRPDAEAGCGEPARSHLTTERPYAKVRESSPAGLRVRGTWHFLWLFRGREVSRVGQIVVGVDGSEESKEALAWAAEQARLTGAKLRAVHAWSIPALAMPSMSLEPASFPSSDDIDAFKESAQRALDEETAAVVPEGSGIDVEKV